MSHKIQFRYVYSKVVKYTAITNRVVGPYGSHTRDCKHINLISSVHYVALNYEKNHTQLQLPAY